MSYKAFAIPNFRRNIKKLSKKYPSIKSDFAVFLDDIVQNPFQGEPLGKGNCYKVRLAIKSKGKGKSGGARVITCIKVVQKKVWLLTIYDKSKQSSITDKELVALLKEIPPEK